jgi:hypothetical protein
MFLLLLADAMRDVLLQVNLSIFAIFHIVTTENFYSFVVYHIQPVRLLVPKLVMFAVHLPSLPWKTAFMAINKSL